MEIISLRDASICSYQKPGDDVRGQGLEGCRGTMEDFLCEIRGYYDTKDANEPTKPNILVSILQDENESYCAESDFRGCKDQRVQRSLGDNQIKSAKLYIKTQFPNINS